MVDLPRSRLNLPVKIFLVAALNLFLLALVFLVFMRVQWRVDFESILRSPAQDRILALARQVALDLREMERDGWDAALDRYSKENHVVMRIVDGRVRQIAGPGDPLPAPIEEALHRSLHGRRGPALITLGATTNPGLHWAAVRIPVQEAGEHRPGQGALVLASPASMQGNLFFFDPMPWLLVGGVVILISVACWVPLVRGLMRSVALMSKATAQIAEGQFDVALPANRRDELGWLSLSINRMAARLSGYVSGQKRFLGDTAHELCSPLARMQVALGILERSASGEQQGIVQDLKDEVEGMSALVNEVLAFSKASLRPSEARLEPVGLEELVSRVAQRDGGGASINVEVEPGLRALANPELLARGVSNVLRNAVRYAGGAGPIEIAARAAAEDVVIQVADCGPGMAEQDLEAVFQPFYRPEAARERETGGVGLGLAIVKTCIESCQGTVRCRNRAPHGLEVEMRLKRA